MWILTILILSGDVRAVESFGVFKSQEACTDVSSIVSDKYRKGEVSVMGICSELTLLNKGSR